MAKTALALAVSLTLVGAGLAHAQDGTGLQAGPFRVKPTLGLTFGHDSNVGQSNVNEVSSFFTLISPGIRFDAGNEARSFSLSYELESARYQDSDIDNYTDHHLKAGVTLSPSVRTKFDLGASLDRGHDRRGTNALQGLPNILANDVDRWERKGLDFDFNYGAPGAKGSLGLGAGISNINYINNKSYSARSDRDLRYVDGKFGWRVAPKTQVYLSANNSQISYDKTRTRAQLANYSLDSTVRTYLLGLEFDATAKTSGHLGFGRTQRNFDDARLQGYSGVAWDVGLQFKPRSYSVIDLSATRGTQESVDFFGGLAGPAVGTDYLIARDITLSWTHGWSDRVHTGVDLGHSTAEYLTNDRTSRNDNLNFWGLSADYKLREWLSLGAGYKSYRRNASVANSTPALNELYDFKRDEFSVTFEASL